MRVAGWWRSAGVSSGGRGGERGGIERGEKVSGGVTPDELISVTAPVLHGSMRDTQKGCMISTAQPNSSTRTTGAGNL